MLRRIPLLMTILLLAACGSAPAAAPAAPTTAPGAPTAALVEATSAPSSVAGFPLIVTDGAGRELRFETPPTRVVALYNNNFGMLATLGVEPVGVLVNPEMLSDPIYFDGKGEGFTRIKAGDVVDAESVAATKPDFIMAYSEEEAQLLGAIAPVYLPGDAATVEDLYPELRRIATILDRMPQAEAAIEAFEDRYAAYQQASPNNAGTVLKLGYQDDETFYISTVDDPICRMLAQIATCAWEKATPDEFWGYETTLEGVLELDPDVIILNNWSSSSRAEMLAALNTNPLWNELKAVQAQRVLGIEGYENPIASSLPAAQKFLDTFIPLIYPDVFPQSLTDAQVQEILAQ
jgi:iron complex transport system substrate-binding protein